MSAKIFQNLMLSIVVLAVVVLAAIAYSCVQEVPKSGDASCLRIESNHNSDLPWEALARQLMGVVSL